MTDTTGTPAEPTAPQISPVEEAAAWTLAEQPAEPSPAPANPWAVDGDVVAADLDAQPRRKARLRWIAAAAVLVVTGTAAMFAVLLPQRTDLPGLQTPNDGRYAFPPLTLPPLPSGRPAPGTRPKDRHYADLRQLVLPAPKGVTSPAADWVPCSDYAALYTDKNRAGATLTENACRAATRRTWTAADGTRTEIWLLRFGSSDEASTFSTQVSMSDLKDFTALDTTGSFDDSVLAGSSVRATEQTAGATHLPVGRMMDENSGDIAYTVVMTNPKGVPAQALHQVALLQSELLG